MSRSSAAPAEDADQRPLLAVVTQEDGDDLPTDHKLRVASRERTDDEPTDMGARAANHPADPIEVVALREELARLRSQLSTMTRELELAVNAQTTLRQGLRATEAERDAAREELGKAQEELQLFRDKAVASDAQCGRLGAQVGALTAFAEAPWYTRLFGSPKLPPAPA
jgi:chromosome segregation ATPase